MAKDKKDKDDNRKGGRTKWQHSQECICRLQNIAMHDYQESVTTRQTDGQTDRQRPDKVIPMCSYASQATQKY